MRVALVAAHPDDEVIGAGGELKRRGGICRLIHVTDGAPRDMRDARLAGFRSRDEYAEARRQELYEALAYVRLARPACLQLGAIDQEASLHMAPLARRLATIFDTARTDVVVTHAYEGGHPDHDATAFAVRGAARLLERDGARVPRLIEMTSYHLGPGGIETGTFIPGGPAAWTIRLSAEERRVKRDMLACFRSQQHTLEPFGVAAERFRAAPACDFTRPPHAGRLFYEHFGWGMDGQRWRMLAGVALARLHLET